MTFLSDIQDYRDNDLNGNYTLQELSMKMQVPENILAEILQANNITPTEQLVNDEYVEMYDLSQFDTETQQEITSPPATGTGVIINNAVHWKALTNTQNLNSLTTQQAVLLQTGSTPNTDVFSNVANGVTLTKDLYNVRVSASVYYFTTVQRANCPISISIDGTPSSIEGASGYVRSASGHNESTTQITETFDFLPAGTSIAPVVRREGAAGTVTSQTGKGYLSVMGNVSESADSIADLLKPIVTGVSPMRVLNGSANVSIQLSGGYFNENTTVQIPGGTVQSVNYLDDDLLEVIFNAGTLDGLYDVIVSNGDLSFTCPAKVEIFQSNWDDLRVGGTTYTDGNAAGNDIRYRSGMSMSRDGNGMFFSGANPWSSWVKFESLAWNRGDNKTIQWVFTTPTSSMMIGIGSNATNETSTSQFSQAEVQAYFQSATTLWGLYGNNGTVGSAGNQNFSTNVTGWAALKIKFESDGGLGAQFTIYGLNSAGSSDWDDESNIIQSFAVGGTLNPNETVLMPFIIPRTDAQRFIAVKVD